MKLIASLGFVGFLISLTITCACAYVWFQGVAFGFHHNVFLGIVSIIPPIGFVEGILHLAGLV